VDFLKSGEQPLHVVEGVRALGMAGQLNAPPGGMRLNGRFDRRFGLRFRSHFHILSGQAAARFSAAKHPGTALLCAPTRAMGSQSDPRHLPRLVIFGGQTETQVRRGAPVTTGSYRISMSWIYGTYATRGRPSQRLRRTRQSRLIPLRVGCPGRVSRAAKKSAAGGDRREGAVRPAALRRRNREPAVTGRVRARKRSRRGVTV
jgi:hypothetical protein